MSYNVTLKSGQSIRVNAPDADVALYRAKRAGFPAVSAKPA